MFTVLYLMVMADPNFCLYDRLLHRKLRMANMDVKLTSEDMEKVELSDDPDLNVDGFSFAEINWNDPQVMDKVLANTSVLVCSVLL